jgi:hypothetical protein
MGDGSSNAAVSSSQICGSAILSIINPGQSYLAQTSGGRMVVLKRLADDCLMGGQLYPSIKQRLARVRELACTQVANLCGVERDPSGDFLVWDYVEGQTWEEFAKEHSGDEMKRMGKELKLAVESLHALGIVHGALHGRNVIVTRYNQVYLTHISPLLYQDPADDWKAVERLIGSAGQTIPIHQREDKQGATIRWRAVVLAGLVALAGAGVAWGIVHHAGRSNSSTEVRP